MYNDTHFVKGTIFDVKEFTVHDGPGVRTTVFFKGCPLSCIWCHNPEGQSFRPELAFFPDKCIGCGRCREVCPHQAQSRELCTACGQCAANCSAGARKLYGREVSLEEALKIALEDQIFYGDTGGVTISGGEPLMQADFAAELLRELNRRGIHTAVDTCGMVSKSAIDAVLPYTDIFLYDIKAIDEDVHKKCTGQSNKQILENIKYIDSLGKAIEVRYPYVPGYNSCEVEAIAEFLSGLKNLTKVRVLAYHNFAGSKYNSLDMENTMPETVPANDEVEKARDLIRSYGISVM